MGVHKRKVESIVPHLTRDYVQRYWVNKEKDTQVLLHDYPGNCIAIKFGSYIMKYMAHKQKW